MSQGKDEVEASESAASAGLQVFIPFLLAGLGMVAAGLLLDRIIHWAVFQEIRELCILVPALLGLKGNLEMTFASRLSSHAALGDLDSWSCGAPLIIANLALVQCQGIVLGFLASSVASLMSYIFSTGLSWDHFFVLCSSAMFTASTASLIIGLVMVFVVVRARSCGCNPDNVAAPVAAALGDITTLSLLAGSSEVMWQHQGHGAGLILVAGYLAVAALCAWCSAKNPQSAPVLYGGWSHMVASLCISSLGGLVLEFAAAAFPRMAAFQPVMNGAGGNLAAVQASRIATHLHTHSRPGNLHEDDDSSTGVVPWSVFLGPSKHARTARVLMLLVVPGHLIFYWAICSTKGTEADGDVYFGFLALYLLGALVQEWFLLYACVHLVHLQWRWGIDPDSAAVPYLTAMGDLCGTALLAGAFAAGRAGSAAVALPSAAVAHGGAPRRLAPQSAAAALPLPGPAAAPTPLSALGASQRRHASPGGKPPLKALLPPPSLALQRPRAVDRGAAGLRATAAAAAGALWALRAHTRSRGHRAGRR